MKLLEVNDLTSEEKQAILNLWNKEYPSRLAYKKFSDFDKYLNDLTNKTHFLLTNDLQEILGWGFKFERDSEKWFAIIIDSHIKGNGWGTLILEAIKKNVTELNGWVIDHNNDLKLNGETYRSPLKFYLKHGFTCNHDIRLETEKISAVKIEWKSDLSAHQ